MKKLFTILFLGFLLLFLAGCDKYNIKITSISPKTKVSNLPSFVLTVYGTNFSEDSKIVFDSKEKETTFVSETELSCTIQPEDIPRKASEGIMENLNPSQDDSYTVDVLVRTPSWAEVETDSIEFTIKADYSFSTPSQFTFDGDYSTGRLIIDFDKILHFAYSIFPPYISGMNDTMPAPLYYIRSTDNGETWSQKVQINAPDQECDDVIPFIDATGAINLIYNSRIRPSTIGGGLYYYTKSTDAGLSWAQPGKLFPMWDNISSLTYDLGSNSINFATIYQEPYLTYYTLMKLAFAVYSGGEWKYSGPIDECAYYFMFPMGMFSDPNGNLTIIYIKEEYINPYYEISLYSAFSSDDGNTWAAKKQFNFLPPNGSGILWLSNVESNKDGKMFMFFGTSSYPVAQRLAKNEQIIRTENSFKIIKNGKFEKEIKNLSDIEPIPHSTNYITTSEDGGATWSNPQTIDFGLSGAVFPDYIRIDDAGNYNLLLISYISTDPNYVFATHFCRSLDKGKTWNGMTKIDEGQFGMTAPEMIISDSGDIYIVISQKTSSVHGDYNNYLVKSIN